MMNKNLYVNLYLVSLLVSLLFFSIYNAREARRVSAQAMDGIALELRVLLSKGGEGGRLDLERLRSRLLEKNIANFRRNILQSD